MRILGVDPSIRATGYGVLEWNEGKGHVLAHGTIRNGASLSQARCLLAIMETLGRVIREFRPEEAAMESIIYVQSTKTAIAMGSARGAVLIAAAQAGLELTEYPAKSVKKAATGWGGARKTQVGFMIRALLGMRETPEPDAADALAVALAHAQGKNLAVRLGKP